MRAAAGVVVLAIALAGCAAEGGQPTNPPPIESESAPPDPETMTVRGTVRVEMDFGAVYKAGSPSLGGECVVRAGYDDMREGAQVSVLDAAGVVIGLGSLVDEGLDLPRGSTSLTDAWCGFSFEVEGVPMGEAFYQVQVAGRDPHRVDAHEARTTSIDLTLGDVPSP